MNRFVMYDRNEQANFAGSGRTSSSAASPLL